MSELGSSGLGLYTKQRPSRSGVAVALTVLAACVALAAIVVVNAFGATEAPAKHTASKKSAWCTHNCAPVLYAWGVQGPRKTTGDASRFLIALRYDGRSTGEFRPLAQGFIPGVRVQLFLPSGMKLLKSGSFNSSFSFSGWGADGRKGRPPASERRWTYPKGVPTWLALQVDGVVAPNVSFWVSGQPGQCFTERVAIMTKYHKHWVKIAHSPVQTSRGCLPGAPPTTTTTG